MKTTTEASGWSDALAGASPAVALSPKRLGEVYLACEGRLVATAQRMVRDPDAARDVVQGALERALRSLGGFRGDARPSTWLHRIVVNQALMWLRARRRRARREQPFEVYEALASHAPEDVAARIDAARASPRLHAALTKLSQADRDVLLQCVAHEVDYAAFAARRGENPLAIKTRAFRARHRLASLLREEVDPGRARLISRAAQEKRAVEGAEAPATHLLR